MSSTVIYEKRGEVAYITINRPECLNALDKSVHKNLGEIWDDFESDKEIRVGVLTGMGNKSFSVGQDLKELSEGLEKGEQPTSFGSAGAAGSPRLTERFEMSKPLIGRINGYAFGGGFELALVCDILIASDNAKFALPEAKLGLIPGAGGIFRLVRHMPYKVALGFLMTGQEISAQKAYDCGLVNQVVAYEELDTCVLGWIKDILRCSPLSVMSIKEVARRSMDLDLEDAFKEKYFWEQHRINGNDCREGPKAFIEKRKPNWNVVNIVRHSSAFRQ